jgi:hypothetical protein
VSPEFAPLAAPRLVVASIVTAALAITACALVAIAWMLGWVPSRPTAPAAASLAAAPSPAARSAARAPATTPSTADVALLPGETLVSADPVSAPARAMPAPTTPRYARADPPRPDSPRPDRPRTDPPRAMASATRDSYCVNCGTVTAIVAYPDQWDVRVRFEDGSIRTLRYPTPPPFRNGQLVRLEEGRLVRDR